MHLPLALCHGLSRSLPRSCWFGFASIVPRGGGRREGARVLGFIPGHQLGLGRLYGTCSLCSRWRNLSQPGNPTPVPPRQCLELAPPSSSKKRGSRATTMGVGTLCAQLPPQIQGKRTGFHYVQSHAPAAPWPHLSTHFVTL